MAPNKNSFDPRRARIDQEGSHSHRERIAHKNSNRRTPSEKFAREPVVANSDISQWNSEILFCSIFGMRKENCRKTCGEGSETGWKLAACFVRILRMGSYINWRRWPTICGATAAIFACTRRVCCLPVGVSLLILGEDWYMVPQRRVHPGDPSCEFNSITTESGSDAYLLQMIRRQSLSFHSSCCGGHSG